MKIRQQMLVLVTLSALVGGGSSAHGADTQGLEHVLDQWAVAWSSSDVERLLPLFTNSVEYEDVTLGAVNRGSNALRDFATGTFAAFADLKFELKSRFVAADGKSGPWNGFGEAVKPKTSLTFQRLTSLSRFGAQPSSSLPTERSVATRTIGIWQPT